MTCKYIIDPRTKKRIAVHMKLTLHQAILIHDLLGIYGGNPGDTARVWAEQVKVMIRDTMEIYFESNRSNFLVGPNQYFTPQSKTIINEFAAQLELPPSRQGMWAHTIGGTPIAQILDEV